MMTVETLEDVLFNVSSLAMKGSILVGELPARFAETKIAMNVRMQYSEVKFITLH